MMREILFRGKSVNTGEWVEGSLIVLTYQPADDAPFQHYEIEDTTIGISPNDFMSGIYTTVDPATVGQYTGLTDKNGKKIYEGDIVKYGDTINKVVFEQRNGTAYFGVVMDDTETWHFGYLTNAEGMEVIGNIHDNPELLEDDKESK